MRLLGVLQGELETIIASNTPSGSRSDKAWVARCRRDWRLAEDLVMKLARERRARPK